MSSVDVGEKPEAVCLSNDVADDEASDDPAWKTIDSGEVFDHKRAAVWLEQHGQDRSATTIRRHGIRLEANRRLKAIRGKSPAPMMLEAEPRVARIVATPRESRARRASTASRASPGDSDPSPPEAEPPPVDTWRGLAAASFRMVQHCERRRAKWAAAL